MDFEHKIYLERAQNELNLSMMIMKISSDDNLQINTFSTKPDTYYSAVISHAYYCIFYSAKAYLIIKGVKTKAPEEHRKTFDEFQKFVERGIIDMELLQIYREMLIKADTLLSIFEIEKKKRGKFTYKRISQANREPAFDSIKNAQYFYTSIHKMVSSLT